MRRDGLDSLSVRVGEVELESAAGKAVVIIA